MKVKDICSLMDSIAPVSLAYDWDNVGLLVGDYEADVNKIMLALDCSDATVDECIKQKADMMITHHPMIFTPLKKINTDDLAGRLAMKLIKNGIQLYSAHTNLDICRYGPNDVMAELFDIANIEFLDVVKKEQVYKLQVYVPKSHADIVRKALGDNGAGHTYRYSHCTFTSKGDGQFMPQSGTSPYIGTCDKLETVEEVKIETIVTDKNKDAVIKAMLNAHPYEEVAYDIIKTSKSIDIEGLGKVIALKTPMCLKEILAIVKEGLQLKTIQYVGNLDNVIYKLAIITGSGMSYYKKAKALGADLYLTSDIKYHEAKDAETAGLNLIDITHFHSEKAVLLPLKKRLTNLLKTQGLSLEILISKNEQNPFDYYA